MIRADAIEFDEIKAELVSIIRDEPDRVITGKDLGKVLDLLQLLRKNL